jgi:hypothetical protein
MDSKRELRTAQKTVTVAGTAEPLTSSYKSTWKVRIKALSTNTANVYVGDSTVSSSNGYQLIADQELELSAIFAQDNFIMDLNEIYVDSDVAGEGVAIAYLE